MRRVKKAAACRWRTRPRAKGRVFTAHSALTLNEWSFTSPPYFLSFGQGYVKKIVFGGGQDTPKGRPFGDPVKEKKEAETPPSQ